MRKHFPRGIYTMRSLENVIESLIPVSQWHSRSKIIRPQSWGFSAHRSWNAVWPRPVSPLVLGYFLAGDSVLILVFCSLFAAAYALIPVLFGF